MKKELLVIVFTALFTSVFATGAMAEDVEGLVKMKSEHSVAETLNRLEKILKSKGITVALRWNHGAKAKQVGIEMRETQLLVFGNPKLGSNFMTAEQTAGIDLPMKALAWKDASGQVWLAYNDPAYIAKRHHITDREEVVKKMSNALAAMTAKAAGK